MAVKATKAEKKIVYDSKLCQLLNEYPQILVVAADNVGSTQLQNIQKGLRGDSVVLMGKNTKMKRSVRIHADKTGNQAFLSLLPLLQGNVGLIFTKGDLKEVSEEVAKYKTIATVCMFLAGKVVETPLPLKDVIIASYEILHKKDLAGAQRKEVYEQQKELVLSGEELVLTTLNFDICICLPYKPLVEAIKRYMVEDAKTQLAQLAWKIVEYNSDF